MNKFVINNDSLSQITGKVLVQKWEESELGWGTRPDGYSLHLSDDDRKMFIREYWASMPERAPSTYSRPNGSSYFAYVDLAIYEQVKKSRVGVSFSGEPPHPEGTDGWKRSV